MSNGATRRDLPAMFLMYGVIFALGAFGLPIANNLDNKIIQEKDLQSISGTVQSAPRTTSGKGSMHLHIYLRASNGIFHLVQDDLTRSVPAIMDLRTGDRVTARVSPDRTREVNWLWELRREGSTILSYEDTCRWIEGCKARGRVIAHWTGGLSLGCFALAILLRKYFGAWRDSKWSAPAGAA